MAAGTELPDLEKRAAEAERRAAEMEHRYDRLTLAVRDNRDLEERVAALEAALAFACTSPPPRPLTEAEMTELQEALDEVAKQGPVTHFLIPSPPPLTPEQVRHLLRECVTVVKPGEVLILRAGEGWTPQQVREVQEAAAMWLEDNAPAVSALVVPPFEIAVVPGGTPGAA